MNSGTSSTELNDMLTNFVKYVDSFYGVNDPLYPMMSQVTKQPLTKYDILSATENYLSMCADDSNELCTWGDGDSLDRERVRDILIEEYQYKFVESKMKSFIIEEKFTGYANIRIEAETEEEALSLYNLSLIHI